MQKRVLTAALCATVGGVGYLTAGALWFPTAFAPLRLLVQSAVGPSLEHTPPKGARQPGERLSLPPLQWVSGSQVDVSKVDRVLLTLFEVTCPVARTSGQFWNRLTLELSRAGIAHVAVGCAPTSTAFAAEVIPRRLNMSVYYGGPCDRRGEEGLTGGIRQYALGSNGVVLDAWAGRPIYRFAENDTIAQMRHAFGLKP